MIKLGGFFYEVRRVPVVSKKERLRGQCNPAGGVILVADWQPEPMQRETLVHEVVHACEIAAGLELPEDTVRRLGRGLFALLRENPHLFGPVPGWKCPSQLKAAGVTYNIKLVQAVDEEESHAWVKPVELEILIDAELSDSRRQECLAFCLVDVAENVMSLDLEDKTKEVLSRWLLAALVDNPGLVGEMEVIPDAQASAQT